MNWASHYTLFWFYFNSNAIYDHFKNTAIKYSPCISISEFSTLKKVWSQNPDSGLYSAKDFMFSMNVTYYFIKMLLSLVYPWKQEDLKIFNCLNIIYWHVTNLMGLWCNLWQLSTSAPCTKEDRCKYKLLLRVSFLQSMLSSARETTLAGSDWKMIPKVSSIWKESKKYLKGIIWMKSFYFFSFSSLLWLVDNVSLEPGNWEVRSEMENLW